MHWKTTDDPSRFFFFPWTRNASTCYKQNTSYDANEEENNGTISKAEPASSGWKLQTLSEKRRLREEKVKGLGNMTSAWHSGLVGAGSFFGGACISLLVPNIVTEVFCAVGGHPTDARLFLGILIPVHAQSRPFFHNNKSLEGSMILLLGILDFLRLLQRFPTPLACVVFINDFHLWIIEVYFFIIWIKIIPSIR